MDLIILPSSVPDWLSVPKERRRLLNCRWNLSATLSCWSLCLCFPSLSLTSNYRFSFSLALVVCDVCVRVCVWCQYWKADRRAPQMGFSCDGRCKQRRMFPFWVGKLKSGAPASLTSPPLRLLTFLSSLHAPRLPLSCSFVKKKKLPFSSLLPTQCLQKCFLLLSFMHH